jgi:hypothetical protein
MRNRKEERYRKEVVRGRVPFLMKEVMDWRMLGRFDGIHWMDMSQLLWTYGDNSIVLVISLRTTPSHYVHQQ